MDEIIKKLLEIEKEYGSEIFFDKLRAIALIKDFFSHSQRDCNLLEKGIELNIYKKIIDLPASDILILKMNLMQRLCDEHGLSEESAKYTIDIWIKLVEKERNHKILESDPTKVKKALDAYKKNLDMPEKVQDKTAAVYDVSRYIAKPSYENNKTKVYDIKKASAAINKDNASLYSESVSNKPMHNILGNILYQSNDFNEAVSYYKKGAEQGDLASQNNLAYCYLYGKGVEKNIPLALEWFAKAAYSGEMAAALNLAHCYYDGIGVHKDISKALPWYKKAAESGDASAQYILGECFYRGEGVKKSKITAVKWFEKAAAQGHERAIELLQELKEYESILRLRVDTKKVHHKNTELSLKQFTKKLMTKIKTEDLINNIKILSDSDDLFAVAKNKLTGFGLRLDINEYPVILYNDNPNGILKFSDAALFTTNGIYIHQPMHRMKFIYYADVNDLHEDYEKKRIWVNRFYINCSTLSDISMGWFLKIIKDVSKEYK